MTTIVNISINLSFLSSSIPHRKKYPTPEVRHRVQVKGFVKLQPEFLRGTQPD
jgi:hypothetical protein